MVVPIGLVAARTGTPVPIHAADTTRTDKLAVAAVLAAEHALGRTAHEMPHNNKGYDIETKPAHGELIFIEVKGRVQGAAEFSITASEILCGLNNAERHITRPRQVADDDSTARPLPLRPLHRPRPRPGFSEHTRGPELVRLLDARVPTPLRDRCRTRRS
ncbi:MAG: DUF3883 domain-containing protein [Acidimicrobiia bacterium]|nr:DUF3883 domain-containing protein [Acidimicrobiia bacterium]